MNTDYEPGDTQQARFRFGPGGIPMPLLFLYLAFLVFFTWYTLEYQLPDYLDQGPGRRDAGAAESAK